MDKGKYLRKPKVAKSKPRFTMPKNIKQKINALLGVGMVLSGLYGTLAYSTPVYAHGSPPKTTKPSETYSIGIVNDNTTINIDGQNIKIDPNSFIIVSEDGALAYDENGNILKGTISDNDFEEVLQLTEDQMSKYTIYQVVSKSNVNVRYSPEITDENKISTVPSLDYVLGYSTETPEYDGEWVQTLSINHNKIHSGYIREDLIREVETFESINNRPEESLKDTERIMMVDTSKDDYVKLKLRSLPQTGDNDNIIEKIPSGSTVKVLGETIKSDNRNWSYIVYETFDGNTVQGWVASSYLNSNIVQQPITQENIQEDVLEIKTNASGSVTGIDVSSMSPEDLKILLQTGIPDNVKSTAREY